MILNAAVKGLLATSALLAVYVVVLTFVSGWGFAQSQFASFWYFIVLLALGFGIQISLYTYLRGIIQNGQGTEKMLGVTGTTSTVAMISCCTRKTE
mgnify:CR=1 FL=1